MADKQYNFLFIVTDQEYAHQAMPEGVFLPNRARMKANGVTFANHHTAHTVCTPSRSTMYTGMHPAHSGMFDNTNFAWMSDMSTDIPTIGHMLREQGYYTAFKGKWHEAELPAENAEDAMEPYGFSDFQEWGDCYGGPHDGYNVDPKIAAEAAGWLTAKGQKLAADGRPWYLAVNFVNPHDIMYFDTDGEKSVQTRGMFPIFDAPDDEIYEPKWNTELPASFDDPRTQQPPEVEYYKWSMDQNFGRIPHDRKDLWHNHVNYYLNCMRDVDRHIGTVLDALEESGLAENTIIIFTADHGEMAAAHGLRQKASVAFKEVVNVPFIVVHPDGPGGATTEAVASHVDITPTLLSYAGASVEERQKRYPQLVGRDLSGVIADPDSDGPRGSSQKPGVGGLMTYDMIGTMDVEWLLRNAAKLMDVAAEAAGLELERDIVKLAQEVEKPDPSKWNMYRAVFDGRHKLVRYFGFKNYNTPETVADLLKNNHVGLYDLRNDPDEVNNLANPDNADYAEELLAEMNAKLNALVRAEIGEDKPLMRPLESE
jgi:arylsulfatase A-like enzyme